MSLFDYTGDHCFAYDIQHTGTHRDGISFLHASATPIEKRCAFGTDRGLQCRSFVLASARLGPVASRYAPQAAGIGRTKNIRSATPRGWASGRYSRQITTPPPCVGVPCLVGGGPGRVRQTTTPPPCVGVPFLVQRGPELSRWTRARIGSCRARP